MSLNIYYDESCVPAGMKIIVYMGYFTTVTVLMTKFIRIRVLGLIEILKVRHYSSTPR